MNCIRAHAHSRAAFVLWLFVAALGMRALVPDGWMPSTSNGAPTITICTGAGMVEAWVDADGKIHKDHSGGKAKGETPCAFAALGFVTDATNPIDVAAPPLAPLAILALSPSPSAIGHGLAARPPPATGPPASV